MKIPAPSFLRQAAPSLALVSLTFALTSCSESRSIPCSAERACPAGWACSADGQACIQTVCGDGVRQSGEVCDDGNTDNGDECNSTCTSNGKCGNGYLDETEQCDDGNESKDDDCLDTCQIARCGDGIVKSQSTTAEDCDYGDPSKPCNLNCTKAECGDGLVSVNEECDSGSREHTAKCNANCTVATCGDGIVNQAAGEECDNGTRLDSPECLSTCKWSRCGDGYINGTKETCDDGNAVTEEHCAYGTQSCNVCTEDCSALVKRKGFYCGDGAINGNEVCDDANTIEEEECSRDTWHCTACSADCSKELILSGIVCGNGDHEWGEACDDGNTESCGSCNAYCTARVSQTKAKGSIKVIQASDINDGETFTLNDGVHVPVIFEFNKTDGKASGHIEIAIEDTQSAEDVAASISNVIKFVPKETLAITSSVTGSTVKLENSQTGGVGNQSISDTVSNLSFSVTGMDGGKPYACSENVGCVEPSDCASGFGCVNKKCTEL
jgi:cysteine-rich repeat protein